MAQTYHRATDANLGFCRPLAPAPTAEWFPACRAFVSLDTGRRLLWLPFHPFRQRRVLALLRTAGIIHSLMTEFGKYPDATRPALRPAKGFQSRTSRRMPLEFRIGAHVAILSHLAKIAALIERNSSTADWVGHDTGFIEQLLWVQFTT